MTKVSISEAIKLVKISRSHFYKRYVNTGEISIIVENNRKLIDVSELMRVFGKIHTENIQKKQLSTIENSINIEEKDKIIELLEKQLVESKERERQFLEREIWFKNQLEKTTHLLEDKNPKKKKKFLGLF